MHICFEELPFLISYSALYKGFNFEDDNLIFPLLLSFKIFSMTYPPKEIVPSLYKYFDLFNLNLLMERMDEISFIKKVLLNILFSFFLLRTKDHLHIVYK